MDYNYNFNEKNVIHTFLCIYDSSKKNKVTIYDIPFMNKWNFQIEGLVLTIYRDSFLFLANKNYLKNQPTKLIFMQIMQNYSLKFNMIIFWMYLIIMKVSP